MKTISQRLWNSGQSWNYEHILATEHNRLRVDIRRNAYEFQSWARGYVFDHDAKKWNLLVNIPITQCQCLKVNYVKDAGMSDFRDDDEQIVKEMLEILE